MAREHRSHVLQAEIALYERLAKIADRGHDRDTTTPRRAALGVVHGWMWPVMKTDPTIASIDPPMSPSQVFLGLTCGASRCRPNHLPATERADVVQDRRR